MASSEANPKTAPTFSKFGFDVYSNLPNSPQTDPETEHKQAPSKFGFAAAAGPQPWDSAQTSNEAQHGQFDLEDDPAMTNPSDSLRIGPKGESSFPCLSEFSFGGATPKATLPSSEPHAPPSSPGLLTNTGNDLQNVDGPESLYRCFSEFSFGQAAPSSPSPYTPPDSPGLIASSQILTLGGDTEIKEKAGAFNGGFEIVYEMYVSLTQDRVCADVILLQLGSGRLQVQGYGVF